MVRSSAKSRQMTHAVVHLLFHALATVLMVGLVEQIGAGSAAAYIKPLGALIPLLIATLAVLAFSFLGIGMMMHEGSHGHLGRNRTVNESLFHIAAALLQTVPSLYRTLHWMHHADLNGSDDWELIPETDGGLRGRKRRRALILLMMFGGFERNRIQEKLLWNPRAPLSPAQRRRGKLELLGLKVVLVGGAVAWFYWFGFFSWLLAYAIPAFLGGWLLAWVQLIEHFGMAKGSTPEATRDVAPRNFIARFFYWTLFHVNYHGVHHDNASLPGPMLADAHDRWIEGLRSGGRTVVDPFPSYRNALAKMLPVLRAELSSLKAD